MDALAILQPLFGLLNERGVQYCVLRNYGFLLNRRQPYGSERSIDLVVSRTDYLVFENCMKELLFQQRKPQFSLHHRAFFYLDGKEAISFDVQVGGVHWNDMCYLDEQHILAHCQKKSLSAEGRNSHFYVPSNENSFVMLLLHSLLGKRRFKPEYLAIIDSSFPLLEQKYVFSRLREVFTPALAGWLLKKVREHQYAQILQKKYILIFYFIFKSHSHIFTSGFLFLRWLRWKKFFQQYPLISIIGPDGAGKTTAVQFLSNHLQKHNRKVTVVYTGRGRSHLLPLGWFGRFYKRKEKMRDKMRDIQKKGRGAIGITNHWRTWLYTVSAPVYAGDLFLRYVFQIFPSRISRRIVITDRYCSDIFLMHHVPLKLKNFLVHLFPRPTLTFYLYNTPEELHHRRNEESPEELARQMHLFTLLNTYLHAGEIKTDTQEKTEDLLAERVMAYMYREWF